MMQKKALSKNLLNAFNFAQLRFNDIQPEIP